MSVAVAPSSAAPGEVVVISGNVPVSGAGSCPAGDPVQLTSTSALFPPDGFGPEAPRGAAGDFEVRYSLPSSTPLGDYQIGLRCGGGNVGVSASLHVAQATTTTAATSTTAAPTTTAGATTTAGSVTTTSSATTTAPSAPASSTGSGGNDLWWVVLLVVAVVAIAVAAWLLWRSRRRAARP